MIPQPTQKTCRLLCPHHLAAWKARLYRRQAFAIGLGLAVAAWSAAGPSTVRANTALNVPNGTTDLTTLGATPANDLTFTGTYTPAANTAFTLTSTSALNLGTLDDLDGTQTLSIADASGAAATITLNGGANSVAPDPADLLYVASGGTLNLTGGTGTTALGLTLNSNGNLDIAGTSTISSIITMGTNAITKTGAGTLTLSGTNTGTGGFTIAAGTVVAGVAGAFGSGNTINLGSTGSATTATLKYSNTNVTLSTGTLNVTSGGTAANRLISATQSIASQLFSLANVNTVLAADLSVDVAGSTVNGVAIRMGNITGTGNVFFNLNGTTSGTNASNIILFSATTFTGGITITGNTTGNLGSLLLNTGTSLKAANSVTLGTGGRFNINDQAPTIAGLNSSAANLGTVTNSSANVRTLTIGGTTATAYDYSGLLTATTPANLKLAIALTGGGSQSLSGATNNYGGGTDVNNGTLIVGNSAALGTGTVTFNSTTAGSTPALQASTDLSGANKLANAFTVANTQGTATIGGANNLEFGGVTTLASGASRTLTINNSATTTFSGNTFLTDTDTAGRTATINGTGNATISGVIDDNAAGTNTNATGLTYSGTGTLTLANAANTYAGVTTVSGGGKLSVGTLANGGTASSIGNSTNAAANLVLNGGTLSYTGSSVVSDRAFTYNSTNGGTIEVTNAATSLEFDGASTGTAATGVTVSKTGAGTLVLGGAADNPNFGLTVSAGEVDFNKSAGRVITQLGVTINGGGIVKLTGTGTDQIQNSNVVTVNNGTFNMNGKSEAAGTLTIGDGTNNGIISGGATSTYTLPGGTATFEAKSGTADVVLAGADALNKTTGGTVTLSQANTYTGTTTISNGKLRLTNGSGSATGTGAVNLGSLSIGTPTNSTLSGTGRSTGLLTVVGGARIAPGVNTVDADGSGRTNFGNAGTVTLGVTGGITLTNASMDFDLASTASGANDRIATGGTLTLGTIAFTFNETEGSLQTGTLYTLISGGTVSGDVSGITTTAYFNGAAYTANYTTDTTDLYVTFTPVPEPGTWAMVAGGVTLLAFVQHRRRKA